MTDRERLINLLNTDMSGCNGDYAEEMANYLLSNGVVVPPCKVGDKVYRVMADKRIKQPYQYKVIGFWYSADDTCNNIHLVRYVNGEFESSMSVPFSEFGITIFPHKEEAEKALKKTKKTKSEIMREYWKNQRNGKV